MKKLGIIAGGGLLPKRLIEDCRLKGRPYCLIALKKNADSDTLKGEECLWVRLGEAGKAFQYLKENQAEELVFIGYVKRPSLFDLCPDALTTKFLTQIGFKAFGDDNLLSLVVSFIENEGFKVVGIHEVLDGLTAPEGVFGKISPDEQALADIAHGIKIAAGIGALDVGQSVVVQQGIVLAVEAVEGTDAMILRCKDLKRDGVGGVLVKMKKPNQEQRTDLPTVGTRTLINAKKAGLRGVAVQAGYTLIVDKEELTKKADELGLFLVGVKIGES